MITILRKFKSRKRRIMYKKIGFVLLLISCFSCANKQEKINPIKRDLTESVYSSVIVQPDSLYQVYSIVAGILDKNLVEEGDLVTTGKPIIQIINNTPKLNTQNAKLSFDLARENYNGRATLLSAIEDEIISATLQYKNDSINFFRQKNIWEQNIGSKAEFDAKKLKYQLSSNNLNLLRSNYNRTKNELKTALMQAENNYKTSLIATTDFTIKSKINGKVYALNKNQGEIVSTMEPIASIGSATDFVIEMLVDEVDIVKITINQKVIVSLDAYKEEVFTGKVSKIYPKKDERNQTFLVEALFDEAPKTLYPGLSGEANIVIDTRKDVLTIPKEYLIDGNKVKTDDGELTIETGLQNMDFVEVLSGITEETPIYKPE